MSTFPGLYRAPHIRNVDVIRKAIIFGIWVAVLGVHVLTCANTTEIERSGAQDMSTKTIEEALKEHTEELMALSGVVGTAQGLCDGQPCIKVFVVRARPALAQKIQAILAGYSVVVEETGKIRPRPAKQD
jgi:hypothetical protein